MALLVGDFNRFAMEEFHESSFLASRDEDVNKIRTSMVIKCTEWNGLKLLVSSF